MVRFVSLLLVFAAVTAKAQFTYLIDQSVPVQQRKGEALSLPWAGGLNAAQFNTMDLNGDGSDDLVLFDRMAGRVITLISDGGDFRFAPEYAALFPQEITNWLLLRDYNCDGRKDIFTGDILGIKVYRNVTGDNGKPVWEQHLFDTGSGTKSNVILTEGSGMKVNLQLQFDDLPSISDIDGDGDIDVLSFQYSGRSVEFHRNMSVENNLPCGSLDFRRVTRSWGNFSECNCGQFAFDGTACPPGTGGRTKHAGGKSLLAIDVNGDGLQDLLFSEAECSLLYALINEGTDAEPLIRRGTPFPAGNAVDFVIFPAVFFEDVDMDGRKDLLASPNIFAREFINTNLQASVWFYKNNGTSDNPDLTLMRRDFLQGLMIDAGDNSVPAFMDADGDGDLDMMISNHSSPTYASTIRLYENTGSASAPSFALVDEDYLGFSGSQFYNVRIQIADMNADGKQDLVFTGTRFDTNVTRLCFIPNRRHDADFDVAALKEIDFQLTSTENVSITDVNGDQLPDILTGRSEGNLEYWKNTGIKGSASFTLEEESFLGYDQSTLRQNLSCSTADLDANGTLDLIIGDQTGQLEIISDFRNAVSGQLKPERNIIFNSLLKAYAGQNLGGRIWPTVANLFNTNKPAIIVGNILGGLHILRHDEGKSLPEEPVIDLYPNPVSKADLLHIRTDRPGTVRLLSVLGQQIGTGMPVSPNLVQSYPLTGLASGIYLLTFSTGGRSYTRRILIR